MKEPIISVEEGDNPENTNSEVRDSFVDRLLLRNLYHCMSHARPNEMVLAHLIMDDDLSKLVDKFYDLCRICALICKSS